MKVVIINKSDSTGGAAVVSFRLMEALREAGVDARMLVAEKRTDSPYVVPAASPARLKHSFIADRLKIFHALGYDRKNLWKIDTGSDGVPIWKHPLVRHADVVCLNWVNQGFVSLRGVEKISAIGKPIVWTMHDMWNMTGVCHHAGRCVGFTHQCGECHLLGHNARKDDLSHTTWMRKQHTWQESNITFVAVSHWLKERSRLSSLLRREDVRVIPNAFPLPNPISEEERDERSPHTVRLIMGAARLDDPIKGLPVLIAATQELEEDSRGINFELITYGGMKDESCLRDVAIPHRHLGILQGVDALRRAYSCADIVVSTSDYETLPGTLIEGQAMGCVPVAFDSGGQRDIIDDGETGFLAPYTGDRVADGRSISEAIRRAAESLSAQRRKVMYESVQKKFAAPSVAANYIRLFNELLH